MEKPDSAILDCFYYFIVFEALLLLRKVDEHHELKSRTKATVLCISIPAGFEASAIVCSSSPGEAHLGPVGLLLLMF